MSHHRAHAGCVSPLDQQDTICDRPYIPKSRTQRSKGSGEGGGGGGGGGGEGGVPKGISLKGMGSIRSDPNQQETQGRPTTASQVQPEYTDANAVMSTMSLLTGQDLWITAIRSSLHKNDPLLSLVSKL